MSTRMDKEWNRFDAATHGVNTLAYEHHEIHNGSHFFISNYTTLGNGATIDFGVQTPDSTKFSHMTFEVEGSQQIIAVLYEVSDYDADGTAITPVNNNRNSPTTSTLGVRSDPTVNTAGNQLYAQSKGANRVAGFVTRNRELVLRRNTKYLFRVTNGATNDNVVSYNAEWYEHTNKS